VAKSIAGSGVTANAISPSAVMTPRLETWLRELADEHGWTGVQEYEQHSSPNSDRLPSGG
jgi:NAD(P)-dependent dehydrogenase (short-subunit alcohol dehydrogenase family)